MKNSVWVAVSFSVLSSIAQGQSVNPAGNGKTVAPTKDQTHTARKLDLTTKPGMFGGVWCAARAKK